MILTISGKPGSGKSVVADILAQKLNFKRYSVGDYRREMAKKRGMTLAEFNKLGEKEDFTDKEADEWQKQLGIKEDNFIIDGRLSFLFIPNSIKIFLDVKPEIGAERSTKRHNIEENTETKEKALQLQRERIKSDIKRYKKYYNINPYNKKHYDLVIDTSRMTEDEVVEKIEGFLSSIKPSNKTHNHKP